jgi:hypothetical protein
MVNSSEGEKHQQAIERNRLLRSLLRTIGDFLKPVSYEDIPLAQLIHENDFLQMLADNAGIYTGQPIEESEGDNA